MVSKTRTFKTEVIRHPSSISLILFFDVDIYNVLKYTINLTNKQTFAGVDTLAKKKISRLKGNCQW